MKKIILICIFAFGFALQWHNGDLNVSADMPEVLAWGSEGGDDDWGDDDWDDWDDWDDDWGWGDDNDDDHYDRCVACGAEMERNGVCWYCNGGDDNSDDNGSGHNRCYWCYSDPCVCYDDDTDDDYCYMCGANPCVCYDDNSDDDQGGAGQGSGDGDGDTTDDDDEKPEDPDDPQDEKKEPCTDTINNKSNPLVDMALAPPVTNGYVNISGATWGFTRNGGTKLHDGIDLAGEIGTPIYAQFSGKVGKVVSKQPNRIGGNYPSDYSDDKDEGGNRIYINSTIDGNSVSNGYMHLQAGTPIGINPRTGEIWKDGDRINAGEIIGYIGITGNSNPAVPHLHLTTKVNGVRVDPARYLAATVSPKTPNITTPCDD